MNSYNEVLKTVTKSLPPPALSHYEAELANLSPGTQRMASNATRDFWCDTALLLAMSQKYDNELNDSVGAELFRKFARELAEHEARTCR